MEVLLTIENYDNCIKQTALNMLLKQTKKKTSGNLQLGDEF